MEVARLRVLAEMGMYPAVIDTSGNIFRIGTHVAKLVRMKPN